MSLSTSRNKKRHAVLLAFSVLLSACGEKNKNTPTTTPTPAPIPTPPIIQPSIAMDTMSQVSINDIATHTLSLLSSVKPQNGGLLSLLSVKSPSIDCPAASNINGAQLTYQLTPIKPGICLYRYTVSEKTSNGIETKSTANNYVLITENATDFNSVFSLPYFTYIDRIKKFNPFKIDIRNELKTVGYPMDIRATLGQNILVMGKGSASPLPRAIWFTPEGPTSFTRLIYTVNVPDGEIKIGRLDVSIEDKQNPLPLAKNFTYPLPVIMGEEIAFIDVAGHISDPLKAPLTLSSVSTLNALASISSTSSCKTCFRFKSNQEGQYKIIYGIKNPRESYAHAEVTINVEKPWKYITNATSTKFFTAPPSESESNQIPLVISSLENYAGNIQIKIPRFSFNVANAFCASQGKRLPLSEELVTLYEARGNNIALVDKWPVTTPYWVFSNTQQEAVSLNNGALSNATQEAFVTCTDIQIIDIIASPLETALRKKETLQFTAKTMNDEGVLTDITDPLLWTSSNPLIASVDEKGLLTAHLKGNTLISGTYRNVSTQTAARVNVIDLTDVEVTSSNPALIFPGIVLKLNAKGVFSNGQILEVSSPVTWRTDNPNIVSIEEQGRIKTIMPGTALIYASIENIESTKPLSIAVTQSTTELLGNTGQRRTIIQTAQYPYFYFKGGVMINGIYSYSLGNSVLLMGGIQGVTFPGGMHIKTVVEITAYSVLHNGIMGISKLTWKGNDGAIYSVGTDNPAATSKTILLKAPIKSLILHSSSLTLGKGFITGFEFNYQSN